MITLQELRRLQKAVVERSELQVLNYQSAHVNVPAKFINDTVKDMRELEAILNKIAIKL